ncbi:hypothetical protein [Geomicrobium sp. JCM 19037]|nr:hypothetical protein [Geomicrobium sp. JCM 19037]
MVNAVEWLLIALGVLAIALILYGWYWLAAELIRRLWRRFFNGG